MKDELKQKILTDGAISPEAKKLIFVLDAFGAPVPRPLIRNLFGDALPNGIWEINHCTDYARTVSDPNLDSIQIFTSKTAYTRAHKQALKDSFNLPDYINKFMFPKW